MVQEVVRDASITLATTDTLISEAKNPPFERRGVLIVSNTSTGGETVSLAVGQEAVAGSGIVLGPGSVFQMSIEAGFNPTNKRISGVGSAATATVSVHEVTYNG